MKLTDPENCRASNCKSFYCDHYDGDAERCQQQLCGTCKYGKSCAYCDIPCRDAQDNMKVQRSIK